MSALTKAMFQVHKKLNTMEIKTDSEVSTKYYTYKYLSHNGLLDYIRPVLEEFGLYLDQGLTVKDGKDIENLKITHAETGESTGAQCLIHNMKDVAKTVSAHLDGSTNQDNVKDAQTLISNLKEDYRAWGAELSYKRRHLLLAKLGLHPDDDTTEQDTATASKEYTPKTNAAGEKCISQKQAGFFLYKTNNELAFREKIVKQYGNVNDIPASAFSGIIEDLASVLASPAKQEVIDGTEKTNLPF